MEGGRAAETAVPEIEHLEQSTTSGKSNAPESPTHWKIQCRGAPGVSRTSTAFGRNCLTLFYSKPDSFQVLLEEFLEKNRKIRGVLLSEIWINGILKESFALLFIFGPERFPDLNAFRNKMFPETECVPNVRDGKCANCGRSMKFYGVERIHQRLLIHQVPES